MAILLYTTVKCVETLLPLVSALSMTCFVRNRGSIRKGISETCLVIYMGTYQL